MARGSLLADGKMDNILTVSSGNKAGVCEVLLCSCVGSQGMLLLCLSGIFSIRRPALRGGFFTTSTTWEACMTVPCSEATEMGGKSKKEGIYVCGKLIHFAVQ